MMNEEFEKITLGFGPLLMGEIYEVPVGTQEVAFEVATGDKINDFDREGSHIIKYYRTDKLSFFGYPLFDAKYRGSSLIG